MSQATARPRAEFTAMTEGTQEDWDRIAVAESGLAASLADRVTDHLALEEFQPLLQSIFSTPKRFVYLGDAATSAA